MDTWIEKKEEKNKVEKKIDIGIPEKWDECNVCLLELKNNSRLVATADVCVKTDKQIRRSGKLSRWKATEVEKIKAFGRCFLWFEFVVDGEIVCMPIFGGVVGKKERNTTIFVGD